MGYNYQYNIRKGEDVSRAIKKFSRKCKKLGIVQEVRDRRHYIKPSMKKRLAKKRAIARHRKELAKQRR
jgi:small subunit ribosomal protein S21